RAPVPAASRVTRRQITVEQPGPAVERDGHVLDVNVQDALGEAAQKLHRVDPLPVQVARVEEEAELLAFVERLEHQLGAGQVEGELPRMDLAGKLHPAV